MGIIETPHRPIRVLIVDDEENLRSVLAKLCSNHGYAVSTASDGHEASISLDRGDKFDIIITDYSMPRANGLNVLRKLRAHLPHAKGVLMSGEPLDPAVREEAEQLADAILEKPFAPTEFFQILQALLDASR